MTRHKTMGEWIRNCRQSKGIRSAAALARKAGLSTNHVATFERGDVRPRWNTAKKIADALELEGEELDEFFRVIDSAGKPKAVKESTSGAHIPEVALWKHFPELLFQVKYHGFTLYDVHPDMIIIEVVPACGALLSWLMLTIDPPSENDRQALRNRVNSVIDQCNASRGKQSLLPIQPTWIASMALPYLWREKLFIDSKTARKITRHLDEWRYLQRMIKEASNTITILLKNDDYDKKWAVWQIEPDEVANLHDAMIVETLWEMLDLTSDYGNLDRYMYINRCTVGDDLKEILESEPEDIRRLAQPNPDDPDALESKLLNTQHCIHKIQRAKFAARTLEIPSLAKKMIGENNYTRDQVIDHCNNLVSVFEEMSL